MPSGAMERRSSSIPSTCREAFNSCSLSRTRRSAIERIRNQRAEKCQGRQNPENQVVEPPAGHRQEHNKKNDKANEAPAFRRIKIGLPDFNDSRPRRPLGKELEHLRDVNAHQIVEEEQKEIPLRLWPRPVRIRGHSDPVRIIVGVRKAMMGDVLFPIKVRRKPDGKDAIQIADNVAQATVEKNRR